MFADRRDVFWFFPGQSVVHEACSKFNTSQFQAERGNFQTTLSNILKDRFTSLHADVTDLQVGVDSLALCLHRIPGGQGGWC